MPSGGILYNHPVALSVSLASWLLSFCAAIPSTGEHLPRDNNPLNIDWDPAPPPEEGPPISVGAIRDPAYLPAQIGGIVGSYAVSLVLVAVLLLILSKTRRDRIRAAENPEPEPEFDPFPQQSEEEYKKALRQFQQGPEGVEYEANNYPGHFRNFSLPSPTGPLSPAKSQHSVFTAPSPTSTVLAAGYDYSVDQNVVRQDKAMAQAQLEEMYRHVMEQEAAKAEGRPYEGPPLPSTTSLRSNVTNPGWVPQSQQGGSAKREKNKPSNLNLGKSEEKSRGSSILNFLKSPRKNKAPTQAMNISSPIMTPMSGTFPRQHEEQEMNSIAPRLYAPAPPPPIPADVLPFRRQQQQQQQQPTPDISPISTQSIDERIDHAIGKPPTREARRAAAAGAGAYRETRDDKGPSHSRDVSSTASSATHSDAEPVSAVSERSTSGLVGLPTSPKPGVNRFPSLDTLPASPRPGQTTFGGMGSANGSRSNVSAVRQGGTLPLRAYEPSLASPTSMSHSTTTKQTVFTRPAEGALSPGMHTGGLRTPWTGAPVPYTPYQPFSPVVPMTPSLVTKADRKRMKRLEPKTPTVEMVADTEDVW